MGHGCDLEPGSTDFHKVAREFAKATQQRLETQRRRNEGQFVESPLALRIEAERTYPFGTSALRVALTKTERT